MFVDMKSVRIVTTIAELRAEIARWRDSGDTIGLVPTMGALHAGHLSLVRQTQNRCARTIASIFVNPAQFAPHEDFDRYPRMLESDAEKLSQAKIDLIFAPTVAEMYPKGFASRIDVDGPSVGLESDFRPHFFGGVATVVAKLLISAMPDFAIFGEKDYQQLLVIRRLTADLGLPIEIGGGPIIREDDGLAMSSRNAYLNAGQRKIAGHLNRILSETAHRVCSGKTIAAAETQARDELLGVGFDSIDYVAIRDAVTLERIETVARDARILAAVKIGGTRLIDNMAV
jgi:pantoate--beta-alanine ligase